MFAQTPKPPYYAVIFTALRKSDDHQGYSKIAQSMAALVQNQNGFLGYEMAESPDGLGILVSYWESVEAIQGWRQNMSHQEAQQEGREKWYGGYKTRICRVERDYEF